MLRRAAAEADKYDYEHIEPLITSVEQDGEVIIFFFRCPATGLEIDAPIIPGEEHLHVYDEPQKGGFFSLLENLFGGDSKAPWEQEKYSQEEIEEAAEDAFEHVAHDFVWDGNRWVWWEANDAVVSFHEQMERGPISQAYEQRLLRRVLVEVLRADGKVAKEELDFFSDILGESPEDKGGLFDYPALEKRDFEALEERRVGDTLLMLGYAMACCDGELAEAENAVLERLAGFLSIGDLRLWELKRFAQGYTIDHDFSHYYAQPQRSDEGRAVVMLNAERIGLDLDEARRIEVRYLKRQELLHESELAEP